jgi:hypothetical protein
LFSGPGKCSWWIGKVTDKELYEANLKWAFACTNLKSYYSLRDLHSCLDQNNVGNRYLEGDNLKSRIASRKTASLHATPVVVSLSGAIAVPAAPDMSGAFVRQTIQASPSGVPAAKAAVERPDNATLSGRLKIILGIADSLADSMDERGTQYGDLLRDHLKDSGLLGLLKTEISFQTSVSAAPAVRQERDRAVEQSNNATLSGRIK